MTVKREMGKENQHNMKLPQQGNYHRPVSGKRTYKHDNLDSFALETMCAHGPAELPYGGLKPQAVALALNGSPDSTISWDLGQVILPL